MARKGDGKRWSGKAAQTGDALDLEPGVFRKDDPAAIAAALKRSAEQSRRREASPFPSALSMLTFDLNRGGRNLPAGRKATLDKAKTGLRRQFGREG